jgi:hypothetical protein
VPLARRKREAGSKLKLRRIDTPYVDVTPGDSPQADAINLILAVANGDMDMLNKILDARQPAFDDGDVMGLVGYLSGTAGFILASLKQESCDEVVAGLRKAAMATAGKLPRPARKHKADDKLGGYL